MLMTTRVWRASLMAGAAALGAGAAPAAAQADRVEIQCYSEPGQQSSCRLPPGTRSVSYLEPDRSMRCREGLTWRRRGNSLWVANGCGGIFEASLAGNGGWGGSGGSGGGWGGSGDGFAGEITCRSRDNRVETCRVNTGGRVRLVQQVSNAPCIEGQSWRYDRSSITVRNGCQGRFAYGYGSGGGWGGSGSSWQGRGYAGELRCASRNNRYQRCTVDTEGRVELVEQLSNAQCRQGRSWGFDRRSIWVDQGCEARFAYGFGNFQPSSVSSGGSGGGGGGSGVAAGLLGAGLAAGLIAILTSQGRSQLATTTGGPARINADYGLFPGAARTEAQACLAEGARQIGQTGATALDLNAVPAARQQAGSWRFVVDATGTWPDHRSRMEIDCAATGTRVTAFDVSGR
ncbi:MAG: DUF3011 domain-containing protein [Sphingomonadaceae bacterium]|uniref:DUF3011 domain-containing protein n=1 Tax=Thermaurantiacus sp. TaxID=2820283 RepID=UPI00298F1787|nr:DUF3011 domain-containing protein [Thermaurantiacus sp.]MCS6986108.1 DUF3011 domain-containing protein [Sphingomonadaceae bacterium]MDW8414676.1 DUF3011 domain-containing protein [Thermaurantiacus sp.]